MGIKKTIAFNMYFTNFMMVVIAFLMFTILIILYKYDTSTHIGLRHDISKNKIQASKKKTISSIEKNKNWLQELKTTKENWK